MKVKVWVGLRLGGEQVMPHVTVTVLRDYGYVVLCLGRDETLVLCIVVIVKR